MLKQINMKDEIIKAHQRIKHYIRYTPLIKSHAFSALFNAHVYLKLENTQINSAFKVRGAFNKLLSLAKEIRKKGVVAASSGNHGAAVAYACKQLGTSAKIFVPNYASETKVNAIKLFGADVEFYGDDCLDTEKFARAYASERELEYISPYNDLDIIAGQGTIGYELNEQLAPIDEVYVAIGGGGLISGIASYLKSVNKTITIVGCLPENSPVMVECINAGKIFEMETKPTLSDATAGNMELDSITFEFCQNYVDNYVLVSEAEIKNALRLLLEKEHFLTEGAASVAMAAAMSNAKTITGKNIIIVISGSNISMSTLQKVICQ